MKIGIDARPLTVKNFAGISNYLYHICKEWIINHPENEYYLMARNTVCFKVEDLPSNWHIVNEPWIIDKGTALWFLFKLPRLIKKYDLDVFWSPNYVLPKKESKTRYYVTVHDLAIYKFKGMGKFRNNFQIKFFMPRSLRNSEKIIAISESTKQDIVERFHVESDKIKVTYLAASLDCVKGLKGKEITNREFSKEQEQKEDIRNNIKKLSFQDYILFIGTIEPRKNIKTIVEGFEKYRMSNPESRLKLVVAGGNGWDYDSIFDRINQSLYKEDIITTGYINEKEKMLLLKNTKVFVFPSEYEGFGIPVLEAFQYGKNAILSNIPPLMEVGKDLAFYIDTHDSNSLAEKIKEAISLDGNEEQAKRLMAQSEKFSWHKCAEETLEAFK